MDFITLHRVCGDYIVEPVTFNVATLNTIMKAQDNSEYNTVIISGNSKYMIQEKYETIIDILENRIADSHVFSTATLSKKEMRSFLNEKEIKETCLEMKHYMEKNFGNESRPEFLTKHMNIPVEEDK